jgi:translation initiation factor 4G
MKSSLKLNLDASSYVPKHLRNTTTNQSSTSNTNNTPLNLNAPSFQHTSLRLDSSQRPFIPRNRQSTANQPSTSSPTPVTKPTKEKKIDREYFVIDEDDKQVYSFDYDYMISFENWAICQETKLLSEDFLKHLEDFKIVDSEPIKSNNQNSKSGKKRSNYNKKENKDKKNETDLSTFGRKDISKEMALAEEFKKKIDEEASKDPIRFKITEHLNILTVDNYKTTSDNIFKIIENDLDYQEKFLDVLFNKSVNEKAYVKLYAKLCKEFDKKLTQRTEPKQDKEGKIKKPTSKMRVKLLDKCREIFKIENNEKFDTYIKVQDPDEREIKLKKFVLGNVNFIGELINIQILSKKIVKQCLNNLFARFNDAKADKSLKMINLEAIVILLDNFGTLLKVKEDKMKEEDKKNFNELVDEYLKKLEEIIEKEQNIVQYVKYKIINLIERSKNNWEKSKFDKSLEAKGKKDLEDEEEEKNDRGKSTLKPYTQDEVTEKMSKDLINFKDFILEEEGTPENYDWNIVESIYRDHGNSVAEMIQGFLYSCLDFVQNDKTLKLARDYFTELIFYYKKSLSMKEKKDIVKKTAHLLRVARDFSLDNLQIIDVWCIMLSNLIRAHLFNRDDLIELNDLEKEDLKTIFIIIAKIIKEDPDAKIHYEKCKFVQSNKALYEEAMNEINK